ncbi:hypothetical protein ACG3SL_08755 [Sphingomonas sp. CJ20]
MILAAALLVQAVAFAPPLDTPLHVVSERRETGPIDRRYRIERTVRFAREGDGYRAEVTLLAAKDAPSDPVGGMFETGLAALAGQRMTLHLDSKGQVIAIDDMAARWEQLCAGVAAAVAARRQAPTERAALAQRIAMPLRALPADRQRDMLGSLVTALIARDLPDPTGEPVPVRIQGASPFGAPVSLEGTRRTMTLPGGRVRTTTRASTRIDLPASGAVSARAAWVEIARTVTADPATGLIESGTETRHSRATEGERTIETRFETALHVDIPQPARPFAP